MKIQEIKIGVPVIYWNIINENGSKDEPLRSEIVSEAWELGHGTIVCKIEGVSGGVSIKHLDLITPGSLMAARLVVPDKFSDNDFNDATKKFFNDKGVNVIITDGNGNPI